MLFNNIDL
jgi:hypothetical protein